MFWPIAMSVVHQHGLRPSLCFESVSHMLSKLLCAVCFYDLAMLYTNYDKHNIHFYLKKRTNEMRPKTELGNLENFLADADLGCFVGRTCFPISSDRQHIQVTFNVITSEYKKFPPSHRFFLWFNTFQNKTPLALLVQMSV